MSRSELCSGVLTMEIPTGTKQRQVTFPNCEEQLGDSDKNKMIEKDEEKEFLDKVNKPYPYCIICKEKSLK